MARRAAAKSSAKSTEQVQKRDAILVEPVPANKDFLRKHNLPITKTLKEHTQAIRDRFDSQARSVTEIALLVGVAKSQYFSEDYAGWIAWAQEQFQYSKRYCNQLAVASNYLASKMEGEPDLLVTDIDKIYQVARLEEDVRDKLLDEYPHLFKMDRRMIRELSKLATKDANSTKSSKSNRGRPKGIFSTARKHLRTLATSVRGHESLLGLLEQVRKEMDQIEADAKSSKSA